VPAHWSTFEGRRSVLASSSANRKAERPVNALLNYVFALLEAEAILACAAVGLDPGLGIVHNDARGRQSMALDIMEPVRPEAEAFVLDMLEGRTFRKAEFTETEHGHVRLRAPLTHELAETLPRWARSLAPIAEKVAHMLGHAMEGKYTPATPLTSAKLRSAQAVVKARKTEAIGRATRDAAKQRPAAPDHRNSPLSITEIPQGMSGVRRGWSELTQLSRGHLLIDELRHGDGLVTFSELKRVRPTDYSGDLGAQVRAGEVWSVLSRCRPRVIT
jgi:hypothetical protein